MVMSILLLSPCINVFVYRKIACGAHDFCVVIQSYQRSSSRTRSQYILVTSTRIRKQSDERERTTYRVGPVFADSSRAYCSTASRIATGNASQDARTAQRGTGLARRRWGNLVHLVGTRPSDCRLRASAGKPDPVFTVGCRRTSPSLHSRPRAIAC